MEAVKMIKNTLTETTPMDITSDTITPAKEADTETAAIKVNAEPAVVVIPSETVAEAVTGRLTTAEKETGADQGTVKERLLTVKSLVTLTITAAFAYLSVTGEIASEQFLTIFTTIIAFYFGIQSTKNKE